MALALNNSMVGAQNDVMDIDIDMDIDDVGPTGGDEMIEEGEDNSMQVRQQDLAGVIPEIYNEDPAKEPQWQKIHLRGVDDMHTNDILAFAKDHFPQADPHVQWIDDTAANLVFENRETAQEAILAFVETATTSDIVQNDPFALRKAKPLASRPASILTIRVAQAGDRKKKNARDASRWYLLHPEDDPGERTRREFANSRPNRGGGGGDIGDYRRRRFDEREHRRRRDKDHNPEVEDFSANMYDDAPSTEPSANNDRGRDLFTRVSKGRRRRSASPGDGMHHSDPGSDDEVGRSGRRGASHYRDRTSPPPYSRRDPNPFPRNNAGKELFSSDAKTSGTLRSDLFATTSSPTLLQQSTSSPRNNNNGGSSDHRQSNIAAAQRLKADLLAASTRNPGSYPTSPRNGAGHRRSHAMDAKNEEDLAERFGRKSLSADSTKHVTAKTHNSGVELFPSSTANSNGNGLSIKGNATVGGGFSFKGRAGAEQVKELFPEQYVAGSGGRANGAGNRGKELFDAPVREKGRRQRAGDLFD